MFTPDQMNRIIFAPAQEPEKIAPGYHTPVAETFRDAALTKMAKVRVLAGTLDALLREHPDDDHAFDTVATCFGNAVQEASDQIQAFRATRDVIGEA